MSTDDDARPAARLTVLSGPSGVGKDSVIELVRARSPWVWLSVSVTTRRAGDTRSTACTTTSSTAAEFERMIADGELLEWAEFGRQPLRHAPRPVEAGCAPASRSC